MNPSDVRRQIEKRLADLEPASSEAEAAKPVFKREDQFLQLQIGVLELFERVARELGSKAKLEIIRHDPPAPEWSVRLTPTNREAARVEAYPDAEDTVHLGLGAAGWVETWIGSGGVDMLLDVLEEYVRAVVRGDLEEVYWLPKGGSEKKVRGSKTYVTLRGKRRRVGELGVIRPFRRAAKFHRKYEAY